MKPTIALTDYNILRQLINNPDISPYGLEAMLLSKELDKAIVIADHILGEEIVRLNSHVEIKNIKTGRVSSFKIVLPSQALLSESKLSVMAPMSIALLGFKKGDSFDWQMPGGMNRILIVSVKNV